MTRRLLPWLAVPMLLAAATARAADPAAPKKVAAVEGITEYTLDNGLRVLLFPDPSTPRVTVNMTVLVGSRHEGYGETGMAHLLEHLVFKGTPKHPDIDGDMKARGAQFNGSTSTDRTNYYETLPASDDNLDYALGLEADRLVNSYIRAGDLATEFSVVRNEFERGENSPQRILGQRMTAVAYEWHNYGKDTIGNRSDIERVPIKNLQAFYRKYYQPDNVVLVVAGKFDEPKALDLVAKHFGPLPRPERSLDAAYTEEPPQDGERVVTLRRVGDVPMVGVMYHVPAAAHPDSAAVQILASVLSAQPSGRLYKALVEPKKVASVFASGRPSHDPGTLEVMAELPKDGNVDEVRDTLIKIVENVADDGVTDEEVDRAKRQYLKNRELAANDANRLATALSEPIAQGDWRLYFVQRDRIEKVTPEQVKDVAAKYLRRSNRTLGVFLPATEPQRTPVPETPSIASIVDGYKGRETKASGESFDASPLAIEKRVTRPDPIEGVKVALLPRKTRGSTVHVTLTLHYGDAESLKPYVTAASFLPGLMQRGTKKMSRQELQDALDKLVATFGGGFGGRGGRGGGGGGGGGLGTASFQIETKRENLVPVLDLLRQVLREPALSADEFELMKVARIAAAEQGRTDPARLAANKLQRLLSSEYAKDDVRYVPTPEEEVERLKATTVDQVRTLYSDFLGASHGELAIVGDFEPSEALPAVAKCLEGWKSGKPYARIERPYQGPVHASRETIRTPDKANATYLAAITLPVGDESPDYPALLIGNFVLGGGSLSSRIADRLRQKEGLSYGAGTGFGASPPDVRSTLTINAICNPQNLRKVVRGVDEEVARLLKDGIPSEELELAKTGFAQQQQIRRSSDTALAGILANNLFLGRTLQHEADLERAVKALTADDVMSALRKYLDPKKLVIVGAGDVPAGEVQ